MSIVDNVKKALVTGTIALASYFSSAAHAQDDNSSHSRDRKPAPAKLSTFEMPKPDAAFQEKQQYGAFEGQLPLGDYAGFGGKLHGRVDAGKGYWLSGNLGWLSGDEHPAEAPFRAVPDLPEAGNFTQDFKGTLNYKSFSLALASDDLYAFGTFGDYLKDVDSSEHGILNPDPSSFQTSDTESTSSLDSKLFGIGAEYQFKNKMYAQLGLFSNNSQDETLTRKHDMVVDQTTDPDTILFESTTETFSKLEAKTQGVLLGVGYPIERALQDKDVTVGLYSIITKRDLEDGTGDSESDTIFRVLGRGTWNGLTLDLGYVSKNRDDDAQFLAALDYTLRFSNKAGLAALAGIDDNGEAFGGAWIYAGDAPDSFQPFMHYVRDRWSSPFEDDIRREPALDERLLGQVRRKNSFFMGAEFRKAFEPRIREGGALDIVEENRVYPMIGFQAGRFECIARGDVGADHNSGSLQANVWVSDNVSVGLGGEFATAKDSAFDDKIAVTAGVNVKFGK